MAICYGLLTSKTLSRSFRCIWISPRYLLAPFQVSIFSTLIILPYRLNTRRSPPSTRNRTKARVGTCFTTHPYIYGLEQRATNRSPYHRNHDSSLARSSSGSIRLASLLSPGTVAPEKHGSFQAQARRRCYINCIKT